ncbi:hypothetical protein KJ765_05700 [Candidatus Micrarchaeota archaeon]|nr:hypothetical protein [Candidatus Micrarchaeota archaeon]
MDTAVEIAVVVLFLMGILFSYAGNISMIGGIVHVLTHARLASFFAISLVIPAVWSQVREAWIALWFFGVIALVS